MCWSTNCSNELMSSLWFLLRYLYNFIDIFNEELVIYLRLSTAPNKAIVNMGLLS